MSVVDVVVLADMPAGEWLPMAVTLNRYLREGAGSVLFLLGPEAAWIHGSILFIDGGNDAEIRPDRY